MDKENTNVDEQQKMLTIMNELVELGKKKENVLELSEIEKVFADQGMELDDDKTEKIFEYLENKGIVAMVPKVTLRMTLFWMLKMSQPRKNWKISKWQFRMVSALRTRFVCI